MFISSFATTDQFNGFIDEIISSPYVIPFDEHAYVVTQHKNYEILRSTLTTQDYNQRVKDIQNLFLAFECNKLDQQTVHSNILLASESYRSSQYSSVDEYWIYPFSKKKFIETFFTGLMPSFQSELISYLTDKLPVFQQVGAGSGSAVIIKDLNINSQVLLDDINNTCSLHSKIKTLSNALVLAEKVLNNQTNDIDFLNHHIETLNQTILYISQELDKERKQGMNGYYKTWH